MVCSDMVLLSINCKVMEPSSREAWTVRTPSAALNAFISPWAQNEQTMPFMNTFVDGTAGDGAAGDGAAGDGAAGD